MSGAPIPTRRLAPEDRTPDEIVARDGASPELYPPSQGDPRMGCAGGGRCRMVGAGRPDVALPLEASSLLAQVPLRSDLVPVRDHSSSSPSQ